uniref:Uncharacterized protein n=1 Tax=Coccidioides posadasii RMSCC 3488 TaxID=454284 RepID=A0A0J6FMK8_COCPO|nr:hypothetical protein CPAG_06421 [Coccidioides posadasii RMSCC 3488]
MWASEHRCLVNSEAHQNRDTIASFASNPVSTDQSGYNKDGLVILLNVIRSSCCSPYVDLYSTLRQMVAATWDCGTSQPATSPSRPSGDKSCLSDPSLWIRWQNSRKYTKLLSRPLSLPRKYPYERRALIVTSMVVYIKLQNNL